MKKKIRFGSLLLAMAVLLALGGCGESEKTSADNGNREPARQTENESEKESDKQEEPLEDDSSSAGEAETPQEENDVPRQPEEADAIPEPEETVPTLNPDTVVYAQEQVCATALVNIRKAPSTDSEVLRVASRREEFTRTANDGEWSAVLIDGTEYYISSQYLALPSEITDNGYLVVIDAGHQAHGNSNPEPIGPGASETKAKVASGTRGVSTGIAEYEMTLAVAKKLRDELEARGYQVIMIRETHDVDISNAERAQVANDAGADAFVRLHGNGVDDSSVHGILAMCQTSSNPYNGNLYSSSRSLSDQVVDAAAAATGAKRLATQETDSMSGINWCQVPATIIEMGFMTNPAEDEALNTDSYQYQMAAGIADGLDAYFGL